MTQTDNDRRIQITATASQTAFTYDFKAFAETDLVVQHTVDATGVTSTLTLTTHYTVSGVGNDAGGTVTLVTGAAVDDVITIYGDIPVARGADYNQAGDFLADTLNNEQDKTIQMLQQLERDIARAVTLPTEDSTTSMELPSLSSRASKYAAFDASGDLIASSGSVDGLTVSTFMETVIDDTTAAAARTTLGVTGTLSTQDVNALTDTTITASDEIVFGDVDDSNNLKKDTVQGILDLVSTTNYSIESTIAPHKNLVVKYVTAATVDIDADDIIVETTGNVPARLSSVNLTVDITTSGANGLDTGAEAGDTWYFLWVIYNGTTTAGLISTSATAPTMPSGYTYKGLVGAVRNDSSSDFIDFWQKNKRVNFTPTALLTGADGATSKTALDMSAVVPSIATGASIETTINSESTTGSPSISWYSQNSEKGRVKYGGHSVSGSSTATTDCVNIPLDTTTVYYLCNFTTTWNIDVSVVGFDYN